MRKSTIALVSLALTSLVLSLAAAKAEPLWTMPGWYVAAEDKEFGKMVWMGPFADEGTCKASLPPNAELVYTCEYLTERPWWDDI